MDAGTAAYIGRMEIYNYPGVGLLVYRSKGDTYTICNANYCVDYVRQDDPNSFYGRNAQRRETHEGRSRDSAGGGGYGGGGGMVGSGGMGVPRVSVGDPKKVGN